MVFSKKNKELEDQKELLEMQEESDILDPQPQLPPENMVEHLRQIIEPEAKGLFPQIHKDLVISNLDYREYYHLCGQVDLIGHLLHLGFENAGRIFLFNTYGRLALSRSKGGFERRMQTTQTVQQSKTIERPPKKGGFFGRN